jgi:hypothetical protein
MPLQHIEKLAQEARQGETGHGVRYVLGVSLVLAVCALGAVLIFAV